MADSIFEGGCNGSEPRHYPAPTTLATQLSWGR